SGFVSGQKLPPLVLQGTKPGAQSGHKKHSTSLKQPFVSSKEATKGESSKAPTSSKTSHSKKRKESSSAMDSNPSQPPVSTHGMDKGAKNTSFDHISAGKGASSIARQVEEEESSRTIKLEDLAKLVSNAQTSFKDLDSPEDDPIIVVADIDEDKEDEVHATS
ncbi:hypothetical protein Tco_0118365, partial [Tanacetum coccineum]